MKAYVDTTVLSDGLLKGGTIGPAAKRAIAVCEQSKLPIYAIKEFKAGPLTNFAYFHNKLVSERSFAGAIVALQRLSRTPQRYKTATALEALAGAAAQFGVMTTADLAERYGADASLDRVQLDHYRLAIEVVVTKAWKRRRQLTTHVVDTLSMYAEDAPKKVNGLLDLSPTRCNPERECCLAADLRTKVEDIKKLYDAVVAMPNSREKSRRQQALRQIVRKPKEKITEALCRDLGDAIFALFCPHDCVILTTNTRDHKPLAEALGKSAVHPYDQANGER